MKLNDDFLSPEQQVALAAYNRIMEIGTAHDFFDDAALAALTDKQRDILSDQFDQVVERMTVYLLAGRCVCQVYHPPSNSFEISFLHPPKKKK